MKSWPWRSQWEFWTAFSQGQGSSSPGALCLPTRSLSEQRGKCRIKQGVRRRKSGCWTVHWAGATAKGLLPRRGICPFHAPCTQSLLAQRQGHNVPSASVRKQKTQVNSSCLWLQTCLGWLLLFSCQGSGSAKGKVIEPLPEGKNTYWKWNNSKYWKWLLYVSIPVWFGHWPVLSNPFFPLLLTNPCSRAVGWFLTWREAELEKCPCLYWHTGVLGGTVTVTGCLNQLQGSGGCEHWRI